MSNNITLFTHVINYIILHIILLLRFRELINERTSLYISQYLINDLITNIHVFNIY